MKIQIDTEAKTVKVLEPVKLVDLVETLKVMLGDKYEEYVIWYTSEDVPWVSHWVIPYPVPIYPYYYETPTSPYYYGTNLSPTVYNVEILSTTVPIRN